MFKIRGTDQKEYGPVSTEIVRQWMAQGRANLQTLAQAQGTEEWKPLSSFPEFSGPAAFAPPLPGSPASPTGPVKTSGLAVAALVCGLFGFLILPALAGLVLAVVALLKISQSQGRLRGQGLAIAGICLSGFMLLAVIPAGLLLPALARAKSKAQTINCVSNMKQVALAIRIYSNDHTNTFPPAATWCDAIQFELGSPKPFRCNADTSSQRCSYGFNAKLDGLKEDKIDPQTVMIFECKGGWNVTGGRAEMISRHQGAYTVGLADGSVQQIRGVANLSKLRWDP